MTRCMQLSVNTQSRIVHPRPFKRKKRRILVNSDVSLQTHDSRGCGVVGQRRISCTPDWQTCPMAFEVVYERGIASSCRSDMPGAE
jgi:hypothetical protein